MEVEIDVHYCGICHSDLNVIDSDWARPNTLSWQATKWWERLARWEAGLRTVNRPDRRTGLACGLLQ